MKPNSTHLLFAFLLSSSLLSAQGQSDSMKNVALREVLVQDMLKKSDLNEVAPIQGTYLNMGKKSTELNLTAMDAIVTEKTGRLVFAKVPGVFVYDMDGSGNQINISTRGLDPHRGWEYNIRKDGILTNSDMYGYPASHYSMPLESIERINIVRGTASLQYGAQFGGMINYVTKPVDVSRKIAFENMTTLGSYGLFSTYNSIGGKVGKLTYQAYMQKRVSDGYRKNGESDSEAQQVSLGYEFSPNLSAKLEWAHSQYVYHLPGGLTDAQFKADPRQSTRSRNYFNPSIHIPSIQLDWKISDRSRLHFATFATLGERNSVLYDKPTNVADTINLATQQYNNRQIDIDNFNSYTTELRYLQQYNLFKQTSTVVAGVQYMNNDLNRRQLGVGTTGSDFDLSLVTPGFGRDLHLKTRNIALFIENSLKLTEGLSVNFGARMESGESDLSGTITYKPATEIPNTIPHQFVLLGGGIDYKLNEAFNFYTGFSQAYRPVLFKDIIPASKFEFTDGSLKDAFGYNFEAGFKGKKGFLKYDVNYFRIQYNNRMGLIAVTDSTVLRTNIGNSATNGVELFVQADIDLSRKWFLSIFTSTSYMDARYHDAEVRNGKENTDVSGNKVESVPEWISRSGLTLKYWRLSLTAQYSYVGASFADALNTVVPNATGSVGEVPAYGLLDFSASYRVNDQITLRAALNNARDEQYFTKRPQLYPGGAVWPSDGRAFQLSCGIKL